MDVDWENDNNRQNYNQIKNDIKLKYDKKGQKMT